MAALLPNNHQILLHFVANTAHLCLPAPRVGGARELGVAVFNESGDQAQNGPLWRRLARDSGLAAQWFNLGPAQRPRPASLKPG